MSHTTAHVIRRLLLNVTQSGSELYFFFFQRDSADLCQMCLSFRLYLTKMCVSKQHHTFRFVCLLVCRIAGGHMCFWTSLSHCLSQSVVHYVSSTDEDPDLHRLAPVLRVFPPGDAKDVDWEVYSQSPGSISVHEHGDWGWHTWTWSPAGEKLLSRCCGEIYQQEIMLSVPSFVHHLNTSTVLYQSIMVLKPSLLLLLHLGWQKVLRYYYVFWTFWTFTMVFLEVHLDHHVNTMVHDISKYHGITNLKSLLW